MGAGDLRLLWETSTFELREGANLIGRKDADITIPEKSLSKEHARIWRSGPRLEIEDAGSKNGTTLNEKPVTARVPLAPGDVIRLGGVELRISGGAAAPAVPEPAPQSGGERRARFTIVAGDGRGRVVTLVGEKPFTIGTKEENALALSGEGISRYHAEVVFEKGVWLLKDLGSRNGTFVGDRKVDLHELATGDEVQIGSVRVRFEADAAPAAPSPLALVDLARQDPKALAKSPHVRSAVMLVVMAACIVFLLLRQSGGSGGTGGGGGTSGPASAGETAKAVHDAVTLLAKDDAVRAQDGLARALRHKGEATNATLLAASALAKIWLEHRSPVAFEWKGASDAIDKLVRGAAPGELDQDCIDWLQKARGEVDAEIPNAAIRTQADTAMGKGQNALRTGKKLEDAIASLREALDLYRSMPPASVFAPSARERANAIRLLLLETLRREGEARIKGDRPRWDLALALFGEARRYAETLDERRPIDEKVGICELNLKDENALIEATKIVQKTDEPHYPRAKELLQGIAPTSRCYKDACAYLDWFKADDLVRGAIRAFDHGDFETAQRLMGDAKRIPSLRPEAARSVDLRLDRWGKVVAAWTAGQKAEQGSDPAGARAAYRSVLELEGNPANYYRARAAKALDALADGAQTDIDAALRAGVVALDAGKCGEASSRFAKALAKSPAGPARAQVEDAVARANKEKGLFKEARRIAVQSNAAQLPRAREILELLASYLPEKDPDRAAASALLARLK